jgi:dephospho-CoA kinase
MLRVGLTGNVGCGKSTVARVWEGRGAGIVDADRVTRELLVPGSAVFEQVVRAFGRRVLAEDGSLDRRKLAGIVFDDGDALSELNGIVHPPTVRRIQQLMEEAGSAGKDIFVVEAALIIEVGRRDDYDVIVLVHADPVRCVERVVESRSLERAEVVRILDSQMASERKKAHADIVIDNDGSLAELRAKAEEVYRKLESMKEAGYGTS